jgi:hypothetical protein
VRSFVRLPGSAVGMDETVAKRTRRRQNDLISINNWSTIKAKITSNAGLIMYMYLDLKRSIPFSNCARGESWIISLSA